MYYTPDLFIHVQRVTWIAEALCKQLHISDELTTKIIRRAMFHDDSEIIAWDIATPVKQNWSEKEENDYERKCANAIPILVSNYWDILWSDYEDILREMEDFESEWTYNELSLIHAIIEYADKLDALMEVSHEFYSGSNSFLNNMKEVFGFDITCFEYVLKRVQRRKKKIEATLWKIINDIWFFNLEQQRNLELEKIVQWWSMHTSSSIEWNTWNDMYDLWKELHFNYGSKEHVSYLYTQNITI